MMIIIISLSMSPLLHCWGKGLPYGLHTRRMGHNPPRGSSVDPLHIFTYMPVWTTRIYILFILLFLLNLSNEFINFCCLFNYYITGTTIFQFICKQNFYFNHNSKINNSSAQIDLNTIWNKNFFTVATPNTSQ
jgi:hypothetical protein